MSSHSLDPSSDLASRVSVLEQRHARLRLLAWLGVLVGAGSLTWGLIGANSEVSEGRLWLARDGQGRVRAMLGVSNDAVGLSMYDSTGKLRLDVGVAPGGVPGLLLLSSQGEPVATLNVSASGPTLRLVRPAESTRVELTPSAVPLSVVRRGQPDTQAVRR